MGPVYELVRIIIIIIIKRISRVPIYHTRWQHRALYNNTNHTHTRRHTHTHTHTHARMHMCTRTHTHARTHVRVHTHTHTHTHRVSDKGMGRAVKNSLEIVIKQVRLDTLQSVSYTHLTLPTRR